MIIQARQVPDDLERNVDLPATAGGGQPKDEAHMTDEEKERARVAEEGGDASEVETKAEDHPQVNKQVQAAPKKK